MLSVSFRCFVYFLNFMLIHEMSCMFSHVRDVVSGQSWLSRMGGHGLCPKVLFFADLKITVESLKSQGNLTSSTSGNPENGHVTNYVF